MLMDAVIAYLPNPLETPAVTATSVKSGEAVEFTCDNDGEPLGLVFKLWSETYGFLYFMKIYSGEFKTGMTVYNPREKKRERVSRIFRMHASHREDIDTASAGDIIALTGLKKTATGDTLCLEHKPVTLESINFANTVISRVIEPKTSGDRDKLIQAIDRIAMEDPSFDWREDAETGQYIINGMGELHLEVTLHRMLNDFKVDANVGKLRVSYREAPQAESEARHDYDNNIGGEQHVGGVTLKIVPNTELDEIKFVDGTNGNFGLAQDTMVAIQESAISSASSGDLAGYPLIHFEIHLMDLHLAPEGSSALALSNATSTAFNKASPMPPAPSSNPSCDSRPWLPKSTSVPSSKTSAPKAARSSRWANAANCARSPPRCPWLSSSVMPTRSARCPKAAPASPWSPRYSPVSAQKLSELTY